MINKYTTQKRRYFSSTEAYTVDVVIEEDGSLDQWIEVNDFPLCAGKGTPIQNLIELRDLINDVVADLQGVNQ